MDEVSSVSEFNKRLEETTGVNPDLFWQRLREQRSDPDADLQTMEGIGKKWHYMSNVINRIRWRDTPEGWAFWHHVSEGRNPYVELGISLAPFSGYIRERERELNHE